MQGSQLSSQDCCRVFRVFMIAFLLTGLLQFSPEQLCAQENAAEKLLPFRLELVPESAVSVSVIRVAKLLEEPAVQPLKKFVTDEQYPEISLLELSPTDVQSITIMHLQLPPETRRRPPWNDVLVVQSRQKLDRAEIRKILSPKKLVETSYQETSFLTDSAPDGVALLFLDDHTFVQARKASFLKKIIDQSQKKQSRTWTDRLQPVSSATVFSGLNMQAARAQEEAATKSQRGRNRPFNSSQFNVWKYPDLILQAATIQDQLTMELIFEQQDHSLEVKQSLSKFVNFMQGLMARSEVQKPGQPDQPYTRFYVEALNNTRVSRSGNRVKLATSLSSQSCTELVKNIVSKFTAPVVARRPDSKLNLKRIMLALHTYHEVHSHFPPAVVMGPDGKTPHSWRVELLPYLNQQELYNQYRMDEPWDSAHNLKIADTEVPVFHFPGSDKPANSSYFVVVGDGTAFGNKQGTPIRDITDGTSNTIAVVEAKRDIPWTRPEDISYDGKKLPQFGGFHTGGYHVGVFDGSVKFISKRIDQETLKLLLLITDGELPSGW